MSKRKTTKEFIKEAKQVHGDKYDYSKVDYINWETKVCIICPEHGEFWQVPYGHLRGQGCPKCKLEGYKKAYSKTTEQFIEDAKKIHGDKYNYSKVNYVNAFTKVCIICSVHGEFWQKPHNHLNGSGCLKCARELQKQNIITPKEVFLERANKIHKNKYDYSLINYVNGKTYIDIICPKHGIFCQLPQHHLAGNGCPKCAHDLRRMSQEEFIKRASFIHNNFYDYSKVKYINNRTDIEIICPKHGSFWTSPNEHLSGKQGCSKCYRRTSQNQIYKRLCEDLQIELQFDARLPWLNLQSLDIYSKDFNFAVEYNGIQHYEPLKFFGGQKAFIYRCYLDAKKEFLCSKNNCKLFVLKYNYTEDDYQELLTQIKELINERNSNSQIHVRKAQNHFRIHFWRGRIRYDNGCMTRVWSGKRRITRPMFTSLFHIS